MTSQAPFSPVLLKAALLSLCMSLSLHAKGTSPALQLESKIGSDLLSAQASAIEAAVTSCVKEDRARCHQYAAAALQSGRADANAIAPYLVIASIKGLSPSLTEKELGSIIYETVKATPDVVLDIVDASARNVPVAMVPEIVRSAILAVPDPYELVAAVPRHGKAAVQLPVALEEDSFKNVRSFKGDGKNVRTPKDPYIEEGSQTLAEAIVNTAINACGTSDPSQIIAAADPALKNWLPLLGGPTVTSPVGTAGNSNYGNEPRISYPPVPVVSK